MAFYAYFFSVFVCRCLCPVRPSPDSLSFPFKLECLCLSELDASRSTLLLRSVHLQVEAGLSVIASYLYVVLVLDAFCMCFSSYFCRSLCAALFSSGCWSLLALFHRFRWWFEYDFHDFQFTQLCVRVCLFPHKNYFCVPCDFLKCALRGPLCRARLALFTIGITVIFCCYCLQFI